MADPEQPEWWNKSMAEIESLFTKQLQYKTEQVEKMRKVLQMVYNEHMQFGWGYDECHDAIIEALGDSLIPSVEVEKEL
jgi:predicted GTPase